MDRARAFVTAVAILCSAGIASSLGTQARDTRLTTGSGVIAGTLVAADNGAGVRHARVVLTSDELSEPLVTTTDDQGAFAFSGLGPARYVIWAAKPGFVTASYGEKRPGSGRAGTAIALADSQRIDRLIFRLPRAAVLSGLVLDEFGEPAQGAVVQARRYVTVSGRRTASGGNIGEVDDRGMYRIPFLPPGDYHVVVSSNVMGRSAAFQAGAAARPSSDSNSPPGVLFSPRPAVGEAPQTGYVVTYYPGTETIWSASVISLVAGEERPGIDIRLRRAQLSRVSGTVRDVDGSVVRGDARLSEVSSTAGAADFEGGFQSARLDDEGRFAFPAVQAGHYTLAVRERSADDRTPSAGRWALQDVVVAGANLDGLALTLQGGLTVSGSVVADTGTLQEIPGGVVLKPAGESRFLAELVFLHAGVTADGRYKLDNVPPGRYEVEFRSSLPEWRLASALFGGRDALDFFVEVKAGDNLAGLLTVTARKTELSGTVLDRTNAPTNSVTVVVFSDDRRYWVPDNRRNRAVEPDERGRFSFQNLPAGTYRLAAVEDFDPVAGVDGVLLRQLAATSAVVVTIADGERKVQDLKIK